MRYGFTLLLAFAFCVTCVAAEFGQDASPQGAPPTAPRLDGDGDPLPPGAQRRFGTRLWRHRREGNRLSWSPDEKRLAYISDYREVRIVDAETGRLVSAFVPRGDDADVQRPQGLSYSPDGEELAVRGHGGLYFFAAHTGMHVRTHKLELEEFFDESGTLVYSPNGQLVAVADGGKYAIVDAKSGEVVLRDDTRAQIQGLAFSANSKQLAVASLNPSLKVWDLAKREIIARWTYADEFFVYGPAISPDGKFVAVGHREVIVVDPFKGEQKASLQGDDPRDLFLQLAFTADGKHLVAASQEGQVYVWNTDDWTRKWKLTGNAWVVRSMALRPDGKRVAVGDARNRIWLWSLESGALLFNDRPGHDTEVLAVAFTPDGRSLVTGGGARRTHVWDVGTGKHVRALDASSSSLVVNSDGKRMLTSWHGTNELRWWDLQTGRQTDAWSAPASRISSFAASEEGRLALLLQAGSKGYRIMRLKFPSFEVDGDLISDSYARSSIAISRDGSFAAISGLTGCDLWSLEDARLTELANDSHFSPSLLFSHDGRFLIGSSSDTTVRVWETASSRPLHVLAGHHRVPAALALSPSGRVLASAGGSKSVPVDTDEPQQIRLWDIRTGRQIAALGGHNEDVCALAFSPDGKLLASGLRDTTALVWEVPETAQNVEIEREAPGEDEAATLWEALADDDARRGQQAVVRLAGDSAVAFAVAEERLQPAQPPPDAEFALLVRQLDADAFADRQAAIDRLAAFGSTIAPQLKATMEKTDSAEVRLRCAELLKAAQRRLPQTGPRLAETRAVQLLEWIGDERAAALLAKLAGGAPEAHLTKEAKQALARLAR